MVIHPPKITDGTTPINLAARPDSNAPSSFDDPMNMLFTAETLPFMFSGVSVWINVPRIITLTQSKTPLSIRNSMDNQNRSESAKPIMQTPKPATHHNKILPMFFLMG